MYRVIGKKNKAWQEETDGRNSGSAVSLACFANLLKKASTKPTT